MSWSRILSKVLEQNLIATFEKVDAALLSVIDEIDREKAAGRIDDRALDAYLARIDRRLPESLGIRISNADGVIVHAVSRVGAGPGQYGDQDYFTHLQGDPRAGLIILGPVLGRLSGKWIVIPARRLTAPDSAYTGAVHAPIPVDYVERMFSSIDMGPHGVVILVSGALNVVARQPDVGRSGSTIGSTALSPELRALITSGRPAARYETRSRLDDVKRTYFYRQIGSYPLYLSVGVADQDFLAAWWREVAQIVGLVVVVGLASLMAAWLIGRRWKDRADAIKEVARQEERYRALFSHIQIGFTLREIITDDAGRPVDCRFLAVNQAYLDTYGLRSEEIVGRTWRQVFPRVDSDSTDWMGIYGEVALTGKSVHFEAYSENSGRWNEVTAYRTAPRQVAALLNDITERKRAEDRLRLAASVFSASQEGVMITDAEERILDVNPACCRMTGFDAGELIGRRLDGLGSGRHDKAFDPDDI